jgi:hypothetical protein
MHFKTFLLACCLLFSPFCLLFSQTNVGGTFFSDQHWTLAGSPYQVTSDVQIAPGFTLTIDPGVDVTFNGGNEILIKGAIHAVGTATDQIHFVGTGAQKVIHFLDADLSLSQMRHASISGGYYGLYADGASNTTGMFDNIVIDACRVAVSTTHGGIVLNHSYLSSMQVMQHHTTGLGGQLILDSCNLQYCTLNVYTQDGLVDPLLVNNSECYYVDFEAVALYKHCFTLHNDTMRTCSFRSNYGTGTIENSYIIDSEFSNNLFTQQNQYFYELSYSKIVNTDFIGGIVGNQWHMEVTLDHCLVQREDLTQFSPDACTISYCAFQGTSVSDGIRTRFPNITHSLLQNLGTALRFTNESSSTLHLNHNNFVNNSFWNVICDSTYGIDAQDNWWGTADSLTIFTKIKDYYDNLNDGEVVLGNWAQQPDTNAPISAPNGMVDNPGSGFHALSWNANQEADLAGYNLHWGSFNGWSYPNTQFLGNVTSYNLPDSLANLGFAVTAIDRLANGNMDQVQGHESGFVFSGFIPLAAPQPHAATALNIQVYPNPTNGEISVQLEAAIGETHLRVMDLQGRTLLSQSGKGSLHRLDLQALTSGMYLLQVQNGKGVAVQRIVVQ